MVTSTSTPGSILMEVWGGRGQGINGRHRLISATSIVTELSCIGIQIDEPNPYLVPTGFSMHGIIYVQQPVCE